MGFPIYIIKSNPNHKPLPKKILTTNTQKVMQSCSNRDFVPSHAFFSSRIIQSSHSEARGNETPSFGYFKWDPGRIGWFITFMCFWEYLLKFYYEMMFVFCLTTLYSSLGVEGWSARHKKRVCSQTLNSWGSKKNISQKIKNVQPNQNPNNNLKKGVLAMGFRKWDLFCKLEPKQCYFLQDYDFPIVFGSVKTADLPSRN